MGAGVAKFARPSTAVEALRGAGIPSGDGLVRAASLVELTLGALVLAEDSWLARVLLALAYLGFAVFAIAAIRSGKLAPCGCFGSSDGDIGWRHVWTDVVLAVGLCVSAATGATSAWHLIGVSRVLGGATAGVAAIGALLAAAFLSGPVATARSELVDA